MFAYIYTCMILKGKKKKGTKGKTVNLTEFLSGSSIAPKPVNWADETEDIGDGKYQISLIIIRF